MEEHVGQERGRVGQDERCIKHAEGQPDKGGDRLSKRELKRNPGTADGAIRVREVGEPACFEHERHGGPFYSRPAS